MGKIDCDDFEAERSFDVLRGTSELTDVLNVEEGRVVSKGLEAIEDMLVVV